MIETGWGGVAKEKARRQAASAASVVKVAKGVDLTRGDKKQTGGSTPLKREVMLITNECDNSTKKVERNRMDIDVQNITAPTRKPMS